MNELLLRILLLVVLQMSPALRTALIKVLSELEKQAKESQNPWDDILIAILKTLLITH